MTLPEITDVQRLTVNPGDRLVIRSPEKLRADVAAGLLERVRVLLGVPDDVRVVILDGGMSVSVVASGEPAGELIGYQVDGKLYHPSDVVIVRAAP